MRSNWAATGFGVLLAVLLAVAAPAARGLAPVDPTRAFRGDCRATLGPDGEELGQSCDGCGPVGYWRDPRPRWQQRWEERFGPIYPYERLHGGIL